MFFTALREEIYGVLRLGQDWKTMMMVGGEMLDLAETMSGWYRCLEILQSTTKATSSSQVKQPD